MSALELPTYEAFSYYQFTDVLGALSLRLMVMDHTAKYKLCRKRPIKDGENPEGGNSLEFNSEDGSSSDEEGNLGGSKRNHMSTEE